MIPVPTSPASASMPAAGVAAGAGAPTASASKPAAPNFFTKLVAGLVAAWMLLLTEPAEARDGPFGRVALHDEMVPRTVDAARIAA